MEYTRLALAASPSKSSRSMTTKRLPSMRDMSVTDTVSASSSYIRVQGSHLRGGGVVALQASHLRRRRR